MARKGKPAYGSGISTKKSRRKLIRKAKVAQKDKGPGSPIVAARIARRERGREAGPMIRGTQGKQGRFAGERIVKIAKKVGLPPKTPRGIIMDLAKDKGIVPHGRGKLRKGHQKSRKSK